MNSILLQINNQYAAKTIVSGTLNLLQHSTLINSNQQDSGLIQHSAAFHSTQSSCSIFNTILHLARSFASNDTNAISEIISKNRTCLSTTIHLACAERLQGQYPEMALNLLDAQSWHHIPDIKRRGDYLVLAGILILTSQLQENSTKPLSESQIAESESLPDWIEAGIQDCYAKSDTLTDLHARIGWTVYYPKKQYDKVIEFCEKDLNHE